MALGLTAAEVRVLGSLLEKEATTPDAYPLTHNALQSACNQTSGRDPVLALSEDDVHDALDSLRGLKLTRIIHPQTGARTVRYRHALTDVWDLGKPERAVLAVLALRGPQTASELKARTERLHGFGDVAEVTAVLESFGAREHDPYRDEQVPLLALLLPRHPGQREARWVHLLGDEPDLDALATAVPTAVTSTRRSADADRIDALEAEVASLQSRLASIEAALGVGPPG